MNRIQRAKVILWTMAILFQAVLWGLVLFVVLPRMKGPVWLALLMTCMGSIFLLMPFMRVIRGLPEGRLTIQRSTRQWYAWVFAPYWAVLGAAVVFPFSKAAGAVAFVVIFMGFQIYAHLRPRER